MASCTEASRKQSSQRLLLSLETPPFWYMFIVDEDSLRTEGSKSQESLSRTFFSRCLLERTYMNMASVYCDFNELLAAKKNYGHRFCFDFTLVTSVHYCMLDLWTKI